MQGRAVSSSGAGVASGRASGSSGGGLIGGVGSTVGSTTGAVVGGAGNVGSAVGGTVNSTVNSATSATGNVGSGWPVTQLTSTTTGVIGLDGMKLDSAASNATRGSVIASSDKNVQLASGTRMLLRVADQ
jgi:hypothetical protein